MGQGFDQGESGRGDELSIAGARHIRNIRILEHFHDGRNRYRHRPMLAQDRACTIMQGRGQDLVDLEVIQGNGRTYDVDDGVDRADLMEMDLVQGDAMDSRFSLADFQEDGQGELADRFRQAGRFDQLPDIGISPAMGVLMPMVMFGLMAMMMSMFVLVVMVVTVLRVVVVPMTLIVAMAVLGQVNLERGALNATFAGFFRMQVIFSGKAQRAQAIFDHGQRNPDIEQGAQEHITTDAGKAIEIEYSLFHA